MSKFKLFWTEKRIAIAIKWWIAGAVYLLIGWGTYVGSSQYIIDFLFALTVGLFIANRFVYIPIANNMLNLKPKGENYFSASITQRLCRNFYEFTKLFIIVFIIMLTYDLINVLLIIIFNLPIDAVVIPGEPILFGVFYVFYSLKFERFQNYISLRKYKGVKNG